MTLMMLNLMIILLLYLFSFLSIKMKKNKEKLFPFECGFNPFLSPRNPFSLQFFKILLIFLLFDLEIIMILPLPFLQIKFIINNFLVIMTLIIIIMSLYYEWKEGSLKWIK